MSVIERALSSASDYRLNMRMSMLVKGSGMGVESSIAGAVGGPFNAAMNQMNNAAQQYLAASKGYQFTAIQPIAVKVAEQMLRVGVTAPGAMTKRMQKMRLWRKSFTGDEARLLGVDCEPYRHELLFKSAPLHIKHKRQDIEIVEDHVALAAYNDPNPYMCQWSLMYCTAFSIKAVGEAVWVLDPQPDGLLHIWYMPRSWCTPVHTEGNLFTGWKITPPGTTEDVKPIPSSLICHFQLPNPGNPMLSQSALSAQALAINTDDEIQRSQYHLVRNMQRPSMLITLGELTDPSGKKAGRPELNDKQRSAMVQSVRRHYQDATKFGDPMVLDAIVDNVQPYLPSLVDLDYKDGSKLTKERIQQGIGTNPFIAGESPGTNRATAWVARELHNDMQVNPILTLCGQELGRKLPVVTNDPHLVVWFDHARAKDPDLVNRRMDAVIKAGAVTKGEAREWAETGEVELLPRDDDDELLKGATAAPPQQPSGQQPGQEGMEPADPEDVQKGFDPYTMLEAIEYGVSLGTKNCGTGAGGFKPGNTCGGSGGAVSATAMPDNVLDAPSSAFPAAFAKGRGTRERFEDYKTGKWTPERRKLHRAIITKLLEGTTPVENPTMHMTGGGPASGKSTVVNGLKMPKNMVVADPDVIKSMLPEYKEKLAAGHKDAAAFVHRESAYLAKKLTQIAAKESRNVMLDGTGDTTTGVLHEKVSLGKSKGLKVVGTYVTSSTETAIARSNARGAETGRYVPESYIREAHKSVSHVVPKAVKDGVFDEFALWDNEDAPRLVATATGKKLTIHDQDKWDDFVSKARE